MRRAPPSTVHRPQVQNAAWPRNTKRGLWSVDCGLVLVLFTILGFEIPGCQRQPVDLKALRHDVLKTDPAFAAALNKHDELASRIEVLERELDLKRTQVEDQIARLRAELREATEDTTRRTKEIKSQLDPEVERLELALTTARDELKDRQRQRANLGRVISSLRKSIKGGTQPAGKERAQLDQELGEHLREMERLDQELAAMNQHIALLENKRRLLRL